MTQFTKELHNFLAQKQDIDEFFLTSLETAMNGLLQAVLSAFLGDEPYEKVGYNSGNSRNGVYSQKFETKYRTVQLTPFQDIYELGRGIEPFAIASGTRMGHFHLSV